MKKIKVVVPSKRIEFLKKMETGSDQDGSRIRLDLPLKQIYLQLAKTAMENRAKLGEANKKMDYVRENKKRKIGPSSDQDSSSINRNIGSWSDLPIELLDLILKRLGAIEFLIFACVCKSWRSLAADAGKKGFMEDRPPLLLCVSKPFNVSSTCHFYSLSHTDDGRGLVKYNRRLPSTAVGKTCVGFSCGYLFMQDEKNYKESQLILVNPFTGHEFHFPSPRNRYCQFILATCMKPYPQFVVIAFSAKFPYLQFRRYGDDGWTIVNTPSEFHWIEDVAVYEGKAYVLTSDARIGALNLDSRPHLRMLITLGYDILARPLHSPGSLHLIADSDRQQLLVVDCTSAKPQQIYRLDFSSKQWVKVNSMGDQALFFNDSIKNSATLSFPTNKAQRHVDVDIHPDCCYELINGGGCPSGFSVVETGIGFKRRMSRVSVPRRLNGEHLYLWCFPSLTSNVDSIF